MEKLDDLIKKELNLSLLKPKKRLTGGCISEAMSYESSMGDLFVKFNDKAGAAAMFEGEYLALQEINKTRTIKVPKPIIALKGATNIACLVTEYLPLNSLKVFHGELGTKLAELHLDNKQQIGSHNYVSEFGFNGTTCCGSIPLANTSEKDWITFYCKQRLEPQVLLTKNDDLKLLFRELEAKIASFFIDIEIIPALLHGDLWYGNAGETETEPGIPYTVLSYFHGQFFIAIFDPASFYGHSEFDLAISALFGGFEESFFAHYHALIPKETGFDKRRLLYQLFHYLNHWNHFGGHYKQQSFTCLSKLLAL